MPEVRCKVESCVFWGRGDCCTAPEIWVKDSGEGANPFQLSDFELAEELDSGVGGGAPATSGQTYCETMRPKVDNDGRGGCSGCR